MKKQKKIVTSVTINPALKEKADELHINYSEAFEKGLKKMLMLKDDEYEQKKRIMDQKKKVMELKAQMRFGEDLSKAINEILAEYSEVMVPGEDIKENEYIMELIKLKAMELDIPKKALEHLFRYMILGKTTKTEIKKFKKDDINSLLEP
ncbi:MAG TPA: type II toxin-antitoxin system CcdA family antitoxin [Methanobacterium sp.]|nr:type II toxin-antitoxin system CcdA family antitoxin [Methanobacterium sp.]